MGLTWASQNQTGSGPTTCPSCSYEEIADTFDLQGKQCPYCKDGVFTADPDFICVS